MTHDEIIEIGKAMSELFKLVTTLDTAMVGVVVAIVEKVFTVKRVLESKWAQRFLWASLASFICSLVFSLWALGTIPYNVVNMLKEGTSVTWVDRFAFYSSIMLFFIGVAFFASSSVASMRSHPSLNTQETVQQPSNAENFEED